MEGQGKGMNIQKIVGNRIKEIRLSLKLSQSELAERADLGNETISRMERGVQGLTLNNLDRVCQALQIPLVSLFDLEKPEDEVVADAVLQEIVNILKHSSPKTVGLTYRILLAIVEAEEQ